MSSTSCSSTSSTVTPTADLSHFSALMNLPLTWEPAAGSMQMQSLMSTFLTLSPTNSTTSSNSNKDAAAITPKFSFESSSEASQFQTSLTKALPTPTTVVSTNSSSDVTQSEALELMREIVRMHEQLQQYQQPAQLSPPAVPSPQQPVPNTTPMSAVTQSPAFTSQEFLSVLLHQQYQQQLQQMLFREAANGNAVNPANGEDEQRGNLLRDYLLGLRPSPSLDAATAHDIMRLSSASASSSPSSSSSAKPVMSQPFPPVLPSPLHPLGTPVAALHPFMWLNSGSATPFQSQPQPPFLGYSALPNINFSFPSAVPVSAAAATSSSSSSSPKRQKTLAVSCSSAQTASSNNTADYGRFVTTNVGSLAAAKTRPHPALPQNAKINKRRRREPGAPKHPLSAYLFFVAEQRQLFAKTAFSAKRTFTEMAQLLGSRWRNMSKLEREPYEKKADEDKVRYEQEKRDHQRRKTIAAAEKAIRDHSRTPSLPASSSVLIVPATISTNSMSYSSVASSEHSLSTSHSSSSNSTS